MDSPGVKNVQSTEFTRVKEYFKNCLEDGYNKLLPFQAPQVGRLINPKGELQG